MAQIAIVRFLSSSTRAFYIFVSYSPKANDRIRLGAFRVTVQLLLGAIALLLLLILFRLGSISARLKDRFPTEREQDSKWAREDPAGHWEAHKNDKK